MLSFHSARKRSSSGRVGLAIAGGGPIGGMYELGALRAMDEALEGLDLTRMDCYVGVSSGAFLAAGLANRMSTAEMCRIFISGTSEETHFRPEVFLRPNVDEYLRRMVRLPGIYSGWARRLMTSPRKAIRWSEMVRRFGGLVPTGLFDSEGIEAFLRDIFSRHGRSNDFRTLGADLFVVAVDLDSGEAVRFGEPGWDSVPISRAVQASSALPGLYSPVQINGRHFLDGALRRTMHASTVLDRGIDLMIGINPLVPFDSGQMGPHANQQELLGLANRGLPAVLSQTLRTLLQSRMQIGMEKYPHQFPNIDQLVFEPNAQDGELFFTNLFSFSARHRVCQLGYRNTLADLHARRNVLRPMLDAHGIGLREDIVNDRQRSILDGLDAGRRMTDTTARLRRALDDVDEVLSARSGRHHHASR